MSKSLYQTFCKLLQRQTYTCLSSRYGIWLCIGGLLLTLISAFQFGEVVVEWSMQQYSTSFSAYHDNVGGRSFQERLCLPMPIDIVYTWVNGSDPKLIADLQKLKLELELQENRTKEDELQKLSIFNRTESLSARTILKKALLHNSKKKKKRGEYAKKDLTGCTFANCVPGNLLVLDKMVSGSEVTLSEIRNLHPSLAGVTEVQNATLSGSTEKKALILRFPNVDAVLRALKANIKWKGKQLIGYQGYFTSDSDTSRPSTVKAEKEVLVSEFKTYTDLAKLQEVLQHRFGKELVDVGYNSDKHVAVVYFVEKNSAKLALELYKGNFTVDGRILKFSQAFLVWSDSTRTKKLSAYDEQGNADISANRFADNQELKYSLRSVEKFSPWIRNVYIVTNGQIPSWLNLDNPRVKIITHQEIFLNSSHLPTFSSPAIESNIFRIPGLSQKFIYMNDDVMFGDDVWPDDFYTHANGQKFYLTWPVPNCNDGCPASWINDKYCDKACNTSECDWDGGDCIGVSRKGRFSYQNWHNQQSRFRLDFCSTGCADTWVGDRYCDTSCNVLQCGFDAGDCGILGFFQLHAVDVLRNNQIFNLPNGLKAMYFNISRIFGSGKISEADYGQDMIVRTAVIAQKHKLLTLTFHHNYSLTTVSFRISGFSDNNETKKVEVKFNMTVSTREIAKPSTEVKPSLAKMVAGTTTNPTIPKVVPIPRTIYPIRISNSDKSINYWNAVNSSAPRPAWPTFSPSEYIIPEISNDTFFPTEIQSSLYLLAKEFEDGDLTLKGYERKKAKILREFLTTSGSHSNNSETTGKPLPHTMITASHQLSTDGLIQISSKIKAQKKETNLVQEHEEARLEENTNTEQQHIRRLLSVDSRYDEAVALDINTDSNVDESEHHSVPNSEHKPVVQLLPTEDEIFLANWIADSKKKQLSYERDMQKNMLEWKERYGDWKPSRAPDTSFFPWERLGVFDRSQERKKRRENLEHYHTASGHNRKLLDTFADSLLHVHRIYNRKFGYVARKVPAHMPHMIDVEVMRELQDILPHEFDVTSSHKLRSSDDMQFAFSYMYFVIGQKTTVNMTELFTELDTDHSGALSDRELRTLATRLYSLPLGLDVIKSFERTLINCSRDTDVTITTEKYYEPALPLVTEALLRTCAPVLKLMNDTKKSGNKYKYETTNDESVAFKMIRGNVTAVLHQLDNIRATKKKFVCLNDNLNHATDTSLVKALLVDFYESLFPLPSQFELGRGYRNRFLYVDNLKEWERQRETSRYRTNMVIGVGILVLLVIVCRGRIIRLLVRLCPVRRMLIPYAGQSEITRLQSV